MMICCRVTFTSNCCDNREILRTNTNIKEIKIVFCWTESTNSAQNWWMCRLMLVLVCFLFVISSLVYVSATSNIRRVLFKVSLRAWQFGYLCNHQVDDFIITAPLDSDILLYKLDELGRWKGGVRWYLNSYKWSIFFSGAFLKPHK